MRSRYSERLLHIAVWLRRAVFFYPPCSGEISADVYSKLAFTPVLRPMSLLTALLPFLQVMPIERGAGLDQKLLLNFSRKLAAGGWCHIFPEGKTVQVTRYECMYTCCASSVRVGGVLGSAGARGRHVQRRRRDSSLEKSYNLNLRTLLLPHGRCIFPLSKLPTGWPSFLGKRREGGPLGHGNLQQAPGGAHGRRGWDT